MRLTGSDTRPVSCALPYTDTGACLILSAADRILCRERNRSGLHVMRSTTVVVSSNACHGICLRIKGTPMAKAGKVKTKFVCSECGYESGGFLGKCPACNTWNCMVEEVVMPAGKQAHPAVPGDVQTTDAQ